MIKIEDKTSASIMKSFDKLREFYGSKWNKIFKSITTDNGSEFADLSNLEQVSKTLVYYAHPYTSCDKGSVERHNGHLREIAWINAARKTLLRSKYGATLFLERS
jgi:IS30 family transposase